MRNTRSEIIDIEKSMGPRKSYIGMPHPASVLSVKSILENEDSPALPHWSVPWADIMMIVFVTFAVLFIYSLSKRDVVAAIAVKPIVAASDVRKVAPQDAAEKFRELGKSLHAGGNQLVSVSIERDQPIKLSASDSLFFDSGKATIKPEGIAFLKKFSEIVKKERSAIRIEGHTDDSPIHSAAFPTNWELSTIRAVTIARFLIEETGLDPARFSVVGRSMYRPAAPNSTEENKAHNRRVEIFVQNNVDTMKDERVVQ